MAAQPTNVRVIITHVPTGKVDHDRVGDHNYQDFRDWITQTAHWAVRNERSVSIVPVER